jgi:hypothetical protein
MGHFFHQKSVEEKYSSKSDFFRSKSCGNSTKHIHWFWFTQIPPLFHTSIKDQCSFGEQKMIWLSDFVCGDWTYPVEEKPLNWNKCKIAYRNCIWFFFLCDSVLLLFLFFRILYWRWSGNHPKMIKTNLSMDKKKRKINNHLVSFIVCYQTGSVHHIDLHCKWKWQYKHWSCNLERLRASSK